MAIVQYLNRVRAYALGVLLVVVAAGVSLDAQAVRATIQGTVKDSSGAALPGATVDVKNTATGVAQSVVADAEGRYTVPELIVGTYDVTASLQGFRTVTQQGITLTVGAQRVVDFDLAVGQLQETITVQGAAAQVDVVSAAVTTTIEQKQIAELPLNGRNYAQLITLAPGVVALSGNNNGSLFGRQQLVSVSGGRPQGQAYLLDNTNIANFWNRAGGSGVLGTTLGVEAIAEFQTVTGTYSAQFGGNGAVINAVTKSGGNQLHGSAFEFVRNSKFDSRNFFDATKPPFKQNQYGGSLGGPIVSDKMFFFANYEGIRQELGLTRVATVPNALARQGIIPINGVLTNVGVNPAIAPVLALYPMPTREIGGGLGQVDFVDTNTGHQNYVLGRIDFTPTKNDTIFGRFVSDTAELTEPFGGSNVPLWPASNNTNNKYATLEHRRIISSRLINQARFGYVRTDEKADDTGAVPELQFFPGRINGSVAIGGGVTTIGANQLNPFDLKQNKYTIADDLFWTRGSHSLKFGGEAQKIATFTFAPFQWGGAWAFAGLQQFLTNQAATLNSAIPGLENATRDFNEWDFVAYFHDEWHASSKLTLNLGLRYSPTTNATVEPGQQLIDVPFGGFTPVTTVFAKNPSKKNFDPRLGFAWDPFDDHKTSIRGGFGMFHDVIAARVYASAYYINPPFQLATEQRPVFPTPFATANVGNIVSQGIDFATDTTPYAMQYNINLQREIAPATVVTVGYVGSKNKDFFKQVDLNPVTPTTVNGQTVYGTIPAGGLNIVPNARVNPRYASLNFGQAISDSTYNSLQLSMNRRSFQNLQSQVSYTYSKCNDISSGNFGGEGGTTATNPYDPEYDRGPCNFDRPHTFRGSAVYTLPFTGNQLVEGWQISTIISLSSGTPFTPTVGDFSGLQTGGQRPSLASGKTIDDAQKDGVNIVQFFDPAAFVAPALGTLGNVGRNSLRGPNSKTVDLSVSKNVRFAGSHTLQFRAEGFNVFNHTNFGQPAVQVFTVGAGGVGIPSATAGRITTVATDARRLQFAVKYLF